MKKKMKLNKLGKIFNYAYKLYIVKDQSTISYKKWVNDNGDKTLRLNYNLSKNSLVFDLGGYRGDWANDIYKKYECKIFIFEPVSFFYKNIKKRFEFTNKIKVFNFGISDSNKETKIFLSDDASSTIDYLDSSSEKIKLVDIVDFIKKNEIKFIDLVKINIEGGEYEVLFRLINSKYVKICKNLQIQFHVFVKDCAIRREEIRSKLLETHHLTYDYPFIWENWELNS